MYQRSEITSHRKRDSDTVQYGELRSYCGTRFVNELSFPFPSFNSNDTFNTRGIVLHVLQARLLHQHEVTVRLKKKRIKVKLILLQCPCQVSMLMINGATVVGRESNHEPVYRDNQKASKTNKKENGATRCLPTQVAQVLKSWSGCKNSGKIWWMMKFLNAETHTPALIMKYLESPHSRDMRIWVSTVFTLIIP